MGIAGAAPSNDGFANAQVISGTSATVTGSNVGATNEAGEPTHGTNPTGASVWYRWTAASSAPVAFDTYGSAVNTVLAVYTGSSVGALTQIAQNTTVSGNTATTWSSVTFTPTSGTTYSIAVDSCCGTGPGSYSLSLNPPRPPNDDFANAQAVSGDSGSLATTNVRATPEPGEPALLANEGASVWYRWTPSTSGAVTFRGTGFLYAAIFGVYTGSSVSSLTTVATGSYPYGSVTFNAEAGTTYTIGAVGQLREQKNFTLAWSRSAPANDNFASPQYLTENAGSTPGRNSLATKEQGEPAHAGDPGGASVWYRWSAPADGRVSISAPGAGFPVLLAAYTGSALDGLTPVGSSTSGTLVLDVAARTSYAIAVDGAGGATGSYTLAWQALAPANDNFESAAAISGTAGTVSVGMLAATKQPGEPAAGFAHDPPTVWWAWTPATSGVVTFDVAGSSYDPAVRVFRGTSLTGLVAVAAEYAGATTVSFVFRAGTTYRIQLAAESRATLTWRLESAVASPIPANDAFANARAIAGEVGRITTTNAGATNEPGEPDAVWGGSSVWFRWTAPADGAVYFSVPFTDGFSQRLDVFEGSSLDSLTRVGDPPADVLSTTGFFAVAGRTYFVRVGGYNGASGSFALDWNRDQPAPPNDYFSAAALLEGERGSVATTTYNASRETDEPDHLCAWVEGGCGSVWYRWTAPRDGTWTFALDTTAGTIAVYTGETIRTLAQATTSAASGRPVSFAAVAGTTYSIAVAGGPFHATLSWSPVAPGIANDNFARAEPIAGERGSVTGTNAGATSEDGEPLHAGSRLYSVWYRWTAPATGTYVFDTVGSSFDTGLAVYTGSDVNALVKHGENDDAAGATTSVLTFGAQAGVVYSIAVAGDWGQAGPLTLNWKRAFTGAPNDAFAAARVITGAAGEVGGSNVGATKEAGEPNHAGKPGGASVWFRWSPRAQGPYLLETRNVAFDTQLAIYAGGSPGTLTEVASNDNWASPASRVLFHASAGMTYSIAVDGWRDDGSTARVDTGSFTLRWAPRPANDDFAAAQPVSSASGSLAGTLVNATVQPAEPGMAFYPEGTTVWYRLAFPGSGVTTVAADGAENVRVYGGSSLGTLALVAGSTDFASSSVTFSAAPQAVYYAQVSSTASGETARPFTLSWRQNAPPNDAFASPTQLSSALWNGSWVQPTSVTASNAGATKEAGEPAHAGVAGGASVWFLWEAPSTGSTSIDTIGSAFDTVLAVYTWNGTAWGLTTVASDNDSGGGGASRVTFSATARAVYRIAVDGVGAATGDIRMTIQPTAPTNDHFVNAAPIGGASGAVVANNNGATKEPGEPNHGDDPGGHSLWYRFTPPVSGVYAVDAVGDRLGALLGIYSGTTVSSLQTLASAAGWEYGGASARFGATAGQTYMIAIDGEALGAQTGVIRLSWQHVAGLTSDSFYGATPISGWSGSLSGSNAGATSEAGEPRIGVGQTLWFKWVAPADGAVRFAVEHPHDGVAVDPVLALYTGGSLGALTRVSEVTEYVHHVVTGGTTYWLQLDSRNGGSTFDLTWRQLAAPANDRLTNAAALAGDNGGVTGSLVDAARERGEPAHDTSATVSVWYRWTAPRSGAATLDLRPQTLGDPPAWHGESFGAHAMIEVYRGTALAFLEPVTDSAAWWGREVAMRVRFDTVAGATYSIAVTVWPGWLPLVRSFRLNWALPPANDAFAAAQAISGTNGSVSGRNSGAGKEPGEPDHSGNRGGRSVWYRWTAPASGTVVFDSVGSRFDALLAVYAGTALGTLREVARDDQAGGVNDARVVFDAVAGTTYAIAVDGFYGPYLLEPYLDTDYGDLRLNWRSTPGNDAFADAETIFDRNGRVAGTNVGASKEAGEPAHAGDAGGRSVWFAWTPGASGDVTMDTAGSGFDTLLAVYTGSAVGGLAPVAASDDADGLRTSHVRFHAQAGTTYRIAVDGKGGGTGRLFLSWRLEGAPANDDLANATTVTGLKGVAWVDNLWATKEPGEPAHAGVPGGASVWFRWVSPISGTVSFESDTGYSDTLLGVYRGSSVAGLTQVASNDDYRARDRSSKVSFTATAGVEYLVAVDTHEGAYGLFPLYWNRPPENDARFNAADIEYESGSIAGTNVWATKEREEKPLAGQAGGASVWWEWKAPATGTVTFDTVGSGFDTLLGLYPGNYYDWTLVASDDNSAGGGASRLTFSVARGVTVYLVADGVGGATGPVVLNWRMSVASPSNDAFGNAVVLSGSPAGGP